MDFNLTKEQRQIVMAAREFARKEFRPRAQEFDREEKFDYSIWKKACDLGFVGIFIDREYGGGGYGCIENCLLNEEFWAVDPGMGSAVLTTCFGAHLLLFYGTEEQKQQVLPELTAGRAIMGCAITEPDAGSDVAGAVTAAVKDGNDWRINGSKMFATNGTAADYMMIFCRTDPDNTSRHLRHSFILVPTAAAGYTATKIRGKLGIRASDTAEIALNDVCVPRENLVGEEGRGFYQLMKFFNHTRIGVCAQAVGLARAALEESLRYVKNRRQFGSALAEFQISQIKLAEMATHIRAARNLCYEAAWQADYGCLDHALVAMAKWFSAKTAVACADEALQLHGGYGYIDDYKVQRLYRDAKVLEIYEGTKEIEKLIIARSLLKGAGSTPH
jgi:alkylation response protein AidB-like acyl-CoA dehydrogenase